MFSIWKNKGFTLLEVLIAISLLALLAATLYSTLFGVMRGRDAVEEESEKGRELRGTLDQLRREIASSFTDPNRKFGFVVEDRDVYGKPASVLKIWVMSPSGGAFPGSDQQEVVYQPKERDGGGIDLMRGARDLLMTSDVLPYLQMENIESFLVECRPVNGTTWQKTWAAGQGLPGDVRVTITVREGTNDVSYQAIVQPRLR